jgi:hypothetical protein
MVRPAADFDGDQVVLFGQNAPKNKNPEARAWGFWSIGLPKFFRITIMPLGYPKTRIFSEQ